MLKKLKQNKSTLIVITGCILLLLLCSLWMRPAKEENGDTDAYIEYENGVVTEILSDNTTQDGQSDGGWRGEQMLTVLVKTGRYKGETLLAYNYVGPLYSVPVKKGDSVTLVISIYENGEHRASVYELNRLPGIVLMLLLFMAATILVGKGNGARSLLSLLFIVLCLLSALFMFVMMKRLEAATK